MFLQDKYISAMVSQDAFWNMQCHYEYSLEPHLQQGSLKRILAVIIMWFENFC